MPHFIRTNARPSEDLARGFSYSMGRFGDEDEAHAGLSGYGVEGGVEDAVDSLDARMGVAGPFTAGAMSITVFEGYRVGTGPDGEDLFAPRSIVATWETTEIRDAADLVERLAALGISDAADAA